MNRPGSPDELLKALLNNYFPMIDGADELDQVVPLLKATGGEFCGCLHVDSEIVAVACRAGFLPMGESFTGRDILMIKSHTDRCVHDLRTFRAAKSEVRRARGTSLRFSTSFRECLEHTVAAHEERWLTEPLCRALVDLAHTPLHGVRALSAELYRGGTMIAGEIGYACGAVYTSMSGFYHESGAGKVQLIALGLALREAGFLLWDLGMPMEYKFALGATALGRHDFLSAYRQCSRQTPAGMSERAGSVLGAVDAYELLRAERLAGRG